MSDKRTEIDGVRGVIRTVVAPTRRRHDSKILGVTFVVWFVVVLGQLLGLLDAVVRNSGL